MCNHTTKSESCLVHLSSQTFCTFYGSLTPPFVIAHGQESFLKGSLMVVRPGSCSSVGSYVAKGEEED